MNMHDDTFDNVKQFQFYQDTKGVAILKIVPAKRYQPKDRKRISINLNKKFYGRLEFTVQETKSISLTKRGKALIVDQHISSWENIIN